MKKLSGILFVVLLIAGLFVSCNPDVPKEVISGGSLKISKLTYSANNNGTLSITPEVSGKNASVSYSIGGGEWQDLEGKTFSAKAEDVEKGISFKAEESDSSEKKSLKATESSNNSNKKSATAKAGGWVLTKNDTDYKFLLQSDDSDYAYVQFKKDGKNFKVSDSGIKTGQLTSNGLVSGNSTILTIVSSDRSAFKSASELLSADTLLFKEGSDDNTPFTSSKKKFSEDETYGCITLTSKAVFSVSTTLDEGEGVTLYYSAGDEWTSWNGSAVEAVISDDGTEYKISFRGSSNTVVSNGTKWVLSATEDVEASGNIMTLLDYEAPDNATMGDSCFANMFEGWTNLTKAPELPTETLAANCYKDMFKGCTSLTKAPSLPATNLASTCYSGMFSGCTALTAAPELKATALVEGCYNDMFNGCSSLSTVTVSFKQWLGGATTDWLKDVSATGKFNCSVELSGETRGASKVPDGWDLVQEIPANGYLTFSSDSPFSITPKKTSSGGYLCYSTDKTNWSVWSGGEITSVSNVIYIAGNGSTGLYTSSTGNAWVISQETGSGVKVSGNIMTLLNCEDVSAITSISDHAFASIFSGCTKLTDASGLTLPAATVGKFAYTDMFQGCTGLTAGPASIAATTLGNGSCFRMFFGCTSLTKAPALPATTLAYSCYTSMFSGCTSLTTASELPATTLADHCYASMFNGCTALATAPSLPATTLFNSCYNGMFSGCTALTSTPELKATALVEGCYNDMFNGCSSLSTVTVSFTQWLDGATTSWLNGVSSTGKFNCSVELSGETRGVSNVPEGWDLVQEIPANSYLTFSSDSPFSITPKKTSSGGYLCYSTDKTNWSVWSSSVGEINSASSGTDNVIYIAGNGSTGLYSQSSDYTTNSWVISQETGSGVKVSGNIMSLLNCEDVSTATEVSAYGFASIFHGCTKLTDASGLTLPAATVGASAYIYMFQGCTGLTAGPASISATTLGNSSCLMMFQGCTSLATAPALPATTLAESCYSNIFKGCTSLTTAPALPATTLATSCYKSMFYGCTSLTTAPALPATTLAEACYWCMFDGCTELTTAPELKATTLVNSCYKQMFENCTKLTGLTVSFKKWSGTKVSDSDYQATEKWLDGANNATTCKLTCPAELTTVRDSSHVLSNWVVDKPRFTITYNANGATGTAPVDSVEHDYGDEVTLAKNTDMAKTDPVEGELTFAGWNTKADGTGTSYSANGKYTVSDNVTLYARWVKGYIYKSPVYNTADTASSGIKEWEECVCSSYTEVTSSDTSWGISKKTTWYVAEGSITIDHTVICYGDVRLILADGCELVINGCSSSISGPTAPYNAITISGGGNLTVYGDSGILTLTAWANDHSVAGSGIGQVYNGTSSFGVVTINGGVVTARGGSSDVGKGGAGIGGVGGKPSGSIIINAGTVTATGANGGAGLGGGNTQALASGKQIVINGGSVTAVSEGGGSAIGAGKSGTMSNDVIVSSSLTVKAGSDASSATTITNSGSSIAGSLAGKAYCSITKTE